MKSTACTSWLEKNHRNTLKYVQRIDTRHNGWHCVTTRRNNTILKFRHMWGAMYDVVTKSSIDFNARITSKKAVQMFPYIYIKRITISDCSNFKLLTYDATNSEYHVFFFKNPIHELLDSNSWYTHSGPWKQKRFLSNNIKILLNSTIHPEGRCLSQLISSPPPPPACIRVICTQNDKITKFLRTFPIEKRFAAT